MIVTVTGERDWLDKQQVWRELDLLLDKHVRGWFVTHPKESLETPYDKQMMSAKQAFILRHGVSGNVDFAANDWGKERGVTIERFHAEWRPQGIYSSAAGPIRNRKMAEAEPKANLGLAFWSGEMRKKGNREYSGTLDCIKALLVCGVRVEIVPPKETT